MSERKNILVTGVYGLIAGAVYNWFESRPDQYDVYGSARRRHPSDRAKGVAPEIEDDHFFLGDLADFEAVRSSVEGMDVVVQLAADPRPNAKWEETLQSNMVGAYNVFEACREAGVKRIVYASSIMVSWGYQQDEPYKAIREGRFEDVPDEIPIVSHLDPPRPTEPYSASKVWGEALARTYSDVHGISCICLRIGGVNAEDKPSSAGGAAIWCSQRDIVDIVSNCVEAPDDLKFDIFYGISDNRYRWVDMAHAKDVLGFEPQDRGEDRL